MQPDSSHFLVALVIVLVLGFGVDRVVWKPRRASLTWQLQGLQIAWLAAVFCACTVALYGFDLRVIVVAATLGALGGLVDVVPWSRLLQRRSARTHLR